MAEYAADIFAHFKSEELTKSARHGYMASQSDINEKVRRATAARRRASERGGLAARALMFVDGDFEGHHLAVDGGAQGGGGPAHQGVRPQEGHVTNLVAAGHPRQQGSHARAHALQRVQGCEKREQNLRPHGCSIADWRHSLTGKGRPRALYRSLFVMTDTDARLKKLRFRAWRRGFREADLILGPFADKHVSTMSPADLDVFELLLEQPDQDLYAWIVETLPTPPAFDHEIMSRIKAFRFQLDTRSDARGG